MNNYMANDALFDASDRKTLAYARGLRQLADWHAECRRKRLLGVEGYRAALLKSQKLKEQQAVGHERLADKRKEESTKRKGN